MLDKNQPQPLEFHKQTMLYQSNYKSLSNGSQKVSNDLSLNYLMTEKIAALD